MRPDRLSIAVWWFCQIFAVHLFGNCGTFVQMPVAFDDLIPLFKVFAIEELIQATSWALASGGAEVTAKHEARRVPAFIAMHPVTPRRPVSKKPAKPGEWTARQRQRIKEKRKQKLKDSQS